METLREITRLTIKGILKFLCAIVFRVKKVGEKNIPNGACIICANHVNTLDPLVLVVCTKRQIRMLAKEELYKSRFMRFLSDTFQMFPVKRNGEDIEAVKNSLRILKNGEVLGLYPEGTRKGMEKGIKPKNGAVLIAIKSGAPIIPVGIQGNFKFFRQIKLNYGKPIHYDKTKINTQNKEEIDKLTQDLMDEIVMLRDERL